MPTAPLRIGLAQTPPLARDLGGNLRAAERVVAAAGEQGVQLVVFPELSLTGYEPEYLAATPSAWIQRGDARLDDLRHTCRERGVSVVLGAAFAIDAPRPLLAAIIVDASGEVRVSGKQHLHGSEHEFFQAGTPAAPFDVAGWKVAVAICFDTSKPEHAANARAAGADLYAVSAVYELGEERRMDLHLGARAMDNRMFSALANGAGATGRFTSCGQSGAWRPNGAALCRATASQESLLVADLDPAELAAYRATA